MDLYLVQQDYDNKLFEDTRDAPHHLAVKMR